MYLTAGHAVAGICFALVGYFATGFYLEVLPEMARDIWMRPTGAVVGLLVGWRVMGDMLYCDYRTAARRGIATSIWFFIWAMVLLSSSEMILRSMDRKYPNTGEAIGKIFEIFVKYLALAVDLKVVATLVLGGMAAGIVAEFANRHWK